MTTYQIDIDNYETNDIDGLTDAVTSVSWVLSAYREGKPVTKKYVTPLTVDAGNFTALGALSKSTFVSWIESAVDVQAEVLAILEQAAKEDSQANGYTGTAPAVPVGNQ